MLADGVNAGNFARPQGGHSYGKEFIDLDKPYGFGFRAGVRFFALTPLVLLKLFDGGSPL
jgi:hypothetical protein